MKKVLLGAVILAFSINTNAQWVQQNSGTINLLSSVCFPTSNVGYVNNYGSIIKTIDGGNNWNPIPSVVIYNTYQLYFTSIDTGYTSGVGGILKTMDGGLTWIASANTIAAEAFYFLTPNIGYAICSNSSSDSVLTFKTTNAGASWNLINSLSSFGSPSGLFFTNQTTGYMVVNSDGIYKTIDGGITWIPKLNTLTAWTLMKIDFPSTSIGYAVGDDSIFKTIDAGETWLPLNYPNPNSLNSVYFSDNNNGYAVGGDGFSQGEIIKTTDGGVNWTVDASNIQTFYSLSFPTPTIGYACGTNGSIYKLDLTTNINETTKDNDLSIYPNPVNNIITIDTKNIKVESLKIINMLGECVYQQLTTINQQSTIDVSSFAKGVYFVEAQTENGMSNRKFIKE